MPSRDSADCLAIYSKYPRDLALEFIGIPQSLDRNPQIKLSRLETATIGTRISVKRATDFTLLGEAIHGCLAVYLSTNEPTMHTDEINSILEWNGVADCVGAGDVLRQLGAVRTWLHNRWPDAKMRIEIPVTQVLKTGQHMNGRMDLLARDLRRLDRHRS